MPNRQLEIVIKIASEHCDDAAQRLAQGREQLDAAAQQLQQLESYRQQYLEQSEVEASRGISVQVLADARRFMAELSGVITSQEQAVDSREREVAGLTESWVESRRYLGAVEKLAAIRDEEVQQRMLKKEQQLLDDLYAQRLASSIK